jgi:hypothetical protein
VAVDDKFSVTDSSVASGSQKLGNAIDDLLALYCLFILHIPFFNCR